MFTHVTACGLAESATPTLSTPGSDRILLPLELLPAGKRINLPDGICTH
jgi:hypothetical protein